MAERCLLREHAEACLFVRGRSPQGPAPGGLGLRRGSGSSRLAVGRVSREPEEELLFGVRGFKIFGGWGGCICLSPRSKAPPGSGGGRSAF